MEWVTAVLGFALGLLSSYLVLRIQRSWQRKDDRRYTGQVLKNLGIEIHEGLERARYMANLAVEGSESFGRIYTGLWDSSASVWQRRWKTLTPWRSCIASTIASP